MNGLIRNLGKLIDWVGYLSALLLILMVLNVFYDVVMRYVFSNASIGMQELEWHLFAAMFMFGIGYTLKEKGHVRVDVIYDRVKPRTKAWIDIVGSLFFALPFTVLIAYYGIDYSAEAYRLNEGSADPGGLPHRWIIRAVIPVSFGFTALCLVYVILENVQIICQNSQKGQEIK